MDTIWIEIPVADLTRAKTFYEAVFEHAPTDVVRTDGREITVIEGAPTVSLNRTPGFVPTAEGSLPYFHLDGTIADVLARVTAAGGTVVEPPAPRGELGVFSLVLDTEGNGLYLHTAG